jgi:hypothetical protein
MGERGVANGGRIFGQFAMQNVVFQMVGAFFGAFGSGKCIGLLLVGAFLCVWYVGVWW